MKSMLLLAAFFCISNFNSVFGTKSGTATYSIGKRFHGRAWCSVPNCIKCMMFAFGNSLTDDGFDVDDQHGFIKYSNGPVWPDYLARLMGCGTNVVNYAYSGALSNRGNYYFDGWSGLLWQVENFLKSYIAIRNPCVVIAIEFGGLNDLLQKIDGNSTVRRTIEENVVNNNIQALEKLLKAGASRIIAIDLFESVSHAPFTTQEWFKEHVNDFPESISKINQDLTLRINDVIKEYTFARIAFVQTAQFWNEISRKFPNTSEPFTHHKNSSFFGEWQKYVWYDDYHPMTQVHRFLAEKAHQAWLIAEPR